MARIKISQSRVDSGKRRRRMQSQTRYWNAVAWIAFTDGFVTDSQEAIAAYATTRMIADLFSETVETVAADVFDDRKNA
jgi:hypothetical protein